MAGGVDLRGGDYVPDRARSNTMIAAPFTVSA
jgi:hypothetical protein